MDTLLTIAENGDTFYTGPLEEALKLVKDEGSDVRTIETDSGWMAVSSWSSDLSSTDDPDDLFGLADEWGRGATKEEALRYMLGAAFGPLDEGCDEDALREALEV